MGWEVISRGILSVFGAFVGIALVLAAGMFALIYADNSPLPDAWNPTKPLSISDPVNQLTNFKLTRALSDGVLCRAASSTGAAFTTLPDQIDSPQCGIKDHVVLNKIGPSRVAPVNTRCQTALRWAMWARHDLQPKAQELFGQNITEIRHFSSYNCRRIRTSSGTESRMSTHATAEAIDVSGFVLNDGTRIDLKRHWDAGDAKSTFLKHANKTACDWFRLTLGPTYNALHADHFHLQHTGWGLCR